MKQKQRGISLVIVVFLVMIMVTLAAGSAMIAADTYRQIGRNVAANKAYYAAEGALEEALLAVKKYGTGFSQSQATPTEINSESLLANYKDDCLAAKATSGDTTKPATGGANGDTTAGANGDTAKPAGGSAAGTGSTANSTGFDLGNVNCEQILAGKTQTTPIKADWKLTTSSPQQDPSFQVQLGGTAKYFSVPIAGTGDAGGSLCGPGEIIPLVNGYVTDSKNGMSDFIDKYNEWLKAEGSTTSGNTAQLNVSGLNAADHPCHWNRLYVSDVGGGDKPGTVTIPLFTQKLINENGMNGLLIQNPSNSYFIDATKPEDGPQLLSDTSTYGGGLKFAPDSEMYIRFRTPCKPLKISDGKNNTKTVEREMCNANERYKLNATDHNDVVVSWKIFELESNPCGTVTQGVVCSKEADDPEKVQHVVGPLTPGKDATIDENLELDKSTEIRENFINKFMSGDLDVKEGILHSANLISYHEIIKLSLGYILSNSKAGPQTFFPANWRFYKPILEMANVSTLDVQDGEDVKNLPYLEYQLLSSTSYAPFSDVYQTITAQAIVNGFKQTIRVKISQGGNILQYVIQQ